MNIEKLRREAESLSVGALREVLTWNETLAEHYDENMDHTGYNAAQTKIEIARDELRKRGYRD